ncbi:MAG: YHS domain-containing (seleno)protein [Pseudomonadota bacterium]
MTDLTIGSQTVSRRSVLVTGGVAAAFLALSGTASDVSANEPRVFTGIVSGVGAGGYDVVAYFEGGSPTKGDANITASHDGATWRFASEENRDRFVSNPARYAPQYGGYCAWAAAEGYTAKGDPRHWKVVDGKLYLNFNRRIQRRWERDIPGNITRADANWPGILSGG